MADFFEVLATIFLWMLFVIAVIAAVVLAILAFVVCGSAYAIVSAFLKSEEPSLSMFP